MLLQLHEWGERTAPPVVALHGIGGFGRRFRKLAEERLAGRFRVVAPDLRGHGSSSWEPPWTIATHVADVLETIDAAGVERARFVGHSYGGRLILELAALEPKRIERAALLDPAIELLADGQPTPLREVSAAGELMAGAWRRQGDGIVACFDLPRGASELQIQ